MIFVKNSNYKNIENDLLILKCSCDNDFKAVYKEDEYVLNVDELIIENYDDYKHNNGTNLCLDNLLCLCYYNKCNDYFVYHYGG